jgi:aryl-alcohol dehydrogenase-like predicted oxidoreductase
MKTHINSKLLALGTVQFGVDYGISNTRGKVPKEEVFKILEFAYLNGVDTLDTAYNYGESEKIIGEFIKSTGHRFKLISKLPKGKNAEETRQILDKSLKNLNSESVYGYLFHDFNSFKENPSLLDTILEMKERGKILKFGFSLYHPEELLYLLDNKIIFDIVQIPYNLFDQRFGEYFPRLKEAGVEIHVRSVFLQGLFFLKPEGLKDRFIEVRPQITLLNTIAKDLNLTISSLCINFVLNNKYIDKIVIGVDNLSNLKENLDSLSGLKKVAQVNRELEGLRIENEQIFLPTNWR